MSSIESSSQTHRSVLRSLTHLFGVHNYQFVSDPKIDVIYDLLDYYHTQKRSRPVAEGLTRVIQRACAGFRTNVIRD